MDAQDNDGYALDASFAIQDRDGSTTTGNVKATTPVAIVGFVAMALAAGMVGTALLTQDRWDPRRSRLAWDWVTGMRSAPRPELPR